MIQPVRPFGPASDNAKRADLDFLRWFAAFLVVVGHSRGLFMGYADDLPAVDGLGQLILKGFYFVTGFPAEAVILFFVLSGYLVGGSTIENIKSKKFSILRYGVDRFSRIYIVLLPALVLGFLLDFTGINFFNNSGLYSNSIQYARITEGAFDQRLTIPNFVGCLLHLQGIVTIAFGSNSPLWSLACEWWYYTIWGFLCLAFTRRSISLYLLIFFLLILLCFYLPFVMSGFIFWLFGVAAAAARNSQTDRRLIFAVLLCLVLVYSRSGGFYFVESKDVSIFLKNISIATFFGLFLWSCAGRSFVVAGAHRKLADFSFSAYITHYPWIMLLAAVANQLGGLSYRSESLILKMLLFFFAVITSFALAWAFARLTEDHTNTLRAKLFNKFKARGAIT